MTVANQITIARIALLPVFIGLGVAYGQSVAAGAPEQIWRYLACVVFGTICAGDWLDGYVARKLNQSSQLGAILDPLVDKLQIFCAVCTLTFSGWQPVLPLWFLGLAVLRDLVILWFAVTIHRRNGHLQVEPLLTGKLATIFQMIAIGWVMLELYHDFSVPIWLIALPAGIFVTISGFTYLFSGLRQLNVFPYARPKTNL